MKMRAGLNIVHRIRERARLEALALIQGERQMSYAELFAACDAVAVQLPASSGRRLRIGVSHPSGMDYIPIALAVLAAGHCFVPIPDELAAAEKQALMDCTGLHGVIEADVIGFKYHARKSKEVTFPEGDFEALNPAFIRFSSGTTGTAKGVVLSHESLLERISAANAGLGIGAGDRVLWVLPMAHHFAVSIVLYLYHGATTVIEEHHLGAELLAAGAKHHVTVMYGGPVHYRQLTANAVDHIPPWPDLRLAVSTAAALDTATALAFQQKFSVPLTQGLGIIEIGLPVLNLEPPQDALEAIGCVLPAYEATLAEPDAEGIGQLLLRGPGLFDAYLHPWTPRHQVITKEGWFATGDLAHCDVHGRYTLKGRSKTLINVGGMKVFPEEVERVLELHPGVRRALVTGRAHPLYGEVPVAEYEASVSNLPHSVTAAELKRHCRKHLASYKIPQAFIAVQALPQTASGKLLRHFP
jgi:long-chain acyl-CoA synthetase